MTREKKFKVPKRVERIVNSWNYSTIWSIESTVTNWKYIKYFKLQHIIESTEKIIIHMKRIKIP